MTTSEALSWLYRTQLFGIKLGLENAIRLVTALDAWPDTASSGPAILHIAGTNGKGSVCALTESIARAAGRHTGLFTSPHLVRYNERIKINGEEIPDTLLAQELTNIRDLIADSDPHPTFFEITAALALKFFKDQRCDLIILETGMGGRLDATNIITPNVSVLTRIDLDHSHWLGDTLAKVATEKAGIIKPRVPVLTIPQTPEVLDVFRSTAQKQDAPFTIIDQPIKELPIALIGDHQRLNAALALAALKTANIPVSSTALAQGLAQVSWPGRFQQIRPGIWLDGAHNPASAEMLVQTWRAHGPEEKPTILLGMLADKDIESVIRVLAPLAKAWIPLAPRSDRALAPDDLANKIRGISSAPVHAPTSLSEALTFPPPLLICGSLFLVGEVLAHFQDLTSLPTDQ